MDTNKNILRTLSVLAAAILLSCVLIQILTSAVIDPYLHATNRYVNYFDFYANNKDENKIYFIGSSFIEYGVNASEVERAMNYSYKAYNLGISADTKNRIVELDSLLRSKPKIVIYGVSYNSFYNDNFTTEYKNLKNRIGFITDKVKLDPYSLQLFNSTARSLIQQSYLDLLAYKRYLLVPSIQMVMSSRWNMNNIFQINYDKPQNFLFKEWNFPTFIICNNTKEEFKNHIYRASLEDNNNKKAFRYMVKRMTEQGIHVIIVNMPLNPNCSFWISNESRINYREIVTGVGCPYYDLEALCSPMEFRDHGHVNSLGKLNVTNKMVEILKIEVQNASKQH